MRTQFKTGKTGMASGAFAVGERNRRAGQVLPHHESHAQCLTYDDTPYDTDQDALLFHGAFFDAPSENGIHLRNVRASCTYLAKHDYQRAWHSPSRCVAQLALAAAARIFVKLCIA